MSWYRVLAIKEGETKDAEGRELHDDWLVADLGCDDDGTMIYVTTDRVHASEFGFLLDIDEQAAVMVAALNAEERKRREEQRVPPLSVWVGDTKVGEITDSAARP